MVRKGMKMGCRIVGKLKSLAHGIRPVTTEVTMRHEDVRSEGRYRAGRQLLKINDGLRGK